MVIRPLNGSRRLVWAKLREPVFQIEAALSQIIFTERVLVPCHEFELEDAVDGGSVQADIESGIVGVPAGIQSFLYAGRR